MLFEWEVANFCVVGCSILSSRLQCYDSWLGLCSVCEVLLYKYFQSMSYMR